MPKKLKVSPNERVDIPDFVRASNDYTSESVDALVQKVLLGDRGYILEGFRVQIINDAGSPAKVVVYNGNAFNPDGTRLYNEADPAYSQEISLTGAATTFYLEVVFDEIDSDSDARAFWDPTIDNVSPIPDGREFNATIVTRTTPTWRIVRPVSTSGFEYSIANPNSIKIPLVKLTTEGDNTIISASNPGLSTDYPATVTEADFVDTVNPTRLKVADARLFSDSSDNAVTIDPGNLTASGTQAALVSFADKENNILVMTGNITGDYPAGTVIQATGRTQEYMAERVSGVPPIVSTGLTDSPDNAARFWQGDEIKGSGLVVSKEDGSVRDDLNVKTLKDRLDFMSAQLREMKWGALRVGDDGIEDSRTPQTVFDVGNTDLRYFDKTRGIEGSATVVVTVGDGVNSFGDFNAGDETAIQKAVESASSGDTIFIKPGIYFFANSVTVDKSLRFIGDGATSSLVTLVDNTPLFVTTSGSVQSLAFKDLGLIASNNQERTIEAAATGTFRFEMSDCVNSGQIFLGDSTAAYSTIKIERSIVTAGALGGYTLVGGAAGNAPSADQVIIEDCIFATNEDSIVLHFSTVGLLDVENNFWATSDTVQDSNSTFVRVYEFDSIGQGRITNTYVDCATADFLPQLFGVVSGQNNHVANLCIDGVTVVNNAGKPQSDQFPFIDVEKFFSLDIRNVLFESPITAATSSCVLFRLGLENDFSVDGAAANILSVEGCHLGYESVFGKGIQVGDITGAGPSADMSVTISSTSLYQCLVGIDLAFRGNAHVTNCIIDGGGTGASAQYGINAQPTGSSSFFLTVDIDGCTIQNIENRNASSVAGIRFYGDVQHAAAIVPRVTNCVIRNIGFGAAITTVLASGISVDAGVTFTRLSVTNNIIRNVECVGAGNVFGVAVLGTQFSLNELGFSINIDNNDMAALGANDNFVNCVGIFLQGTGSGALVNTSVTNNQLGCTTTSIGNFGVALRQSDGTIFQARVCGNIFNVNNAQPSPFGAVVDVSAKDISGLDISNNISIQAGTGTGQMITVTLADFASEGLCEGLNITNNILEGSRLIATGEGTTLGILLQGVGGAAAGNFVGTNISGNTINLTATVSPTPMSCIILANMHFEQMRVCNNSTRYGDAGFNSNARHIFISGLDQDISSGLVVANNVGSNPSGDHSTGQVVVQNCSNVTITGNNWAFTDDGEGDAANVSVDLDLMVDVTFCGNFIRAGLGIEVSMFNVFRLVAVGNAFGGGAASITGVSIPNGIAFTTGEASTLATNLNLSN